jgi:cysteinyl-tRNA synthetase
MLGGSLTVDGVKMSKSLGNVVNIKDALRDYRPEVIRMFMLSAHYSNPVDYSAGGLDGAQAGWDRLYGAVRLTRSALNSAPTSDDGNGFSERLAKAKSEFSAVMDDDFNAPKGIAVLQELTRDVNTLLNSGTTVGKAALDAINSVYNELGGSVLGIIPAVDSAGASNGQREAGLIQILIDLRNQARKSKNFAESDRIRDELARIGVTLEDRADGTIWRSN